MLKKIFKSFLKFLKNYYHSYLSVNYYSSEQEYCNQYYKSKSTALDLGCGKTPRNSFKASELFGLDIDYGLDDSKKIFPCNLGIDKIPFPDQSFDFVTAHDLIEHIPRIIYISGERYTPFIFLMSEILRVLKKDGIFLSNTPAYPSSSAFSDPTHVNIITTHTFKLYFASPFNWAERYGFTVNHAKIGHFELITQGWHNENLITVMRKIL
jgi:SAM-dependent methyltransferase